MTNEFDKLIPLTFNCLFDHALENCPFIIIRKLPLEKRLSIIKNMKQSKKDELFSIHFKCYSSRIKKQNYPEAGEENILNLNSFSEEK
ncbi:MAG TPA: hypothetical protein DDX39_12760 [Bacteroidales bacterium]|nr:MAG: hypothetical protein A2W98_02500 [Bacteroidetes bacterium GWF2_33_38]OFY92005.1 MAG: hypothetical protein A2236_11175 [Bacteroidetes bacterium RIFOXYA2_FULL_33_7]HBF89503.1 hypothetical protein [Bacteroidales bacterium]